MSVQSCTLLVAVTAALLCSLSSVRAENAPLTVRITSPLGRTGATGTVRIVAQIRTEPETALHAVRFFVDGQFLSEDSDGAPYFADWIDVNPFEAADIRVEASDGRGNVAADAIHLKPLEIFEAAQVSSVLVEASVQDKSGRFIRDLRTEDFALSENGALQALDIALQEEVPAMVALLVDSSQSMSRRVDFVRSTAGRLASYLGPSDRMLVAPFSKGLGVVTGPTDDRETIAQAIASIQPTGGTAIVDSLIELAAQLRGFDGRRAVVLITDGYDEHSTHGLDEALEAVRGSQATVYVVGIGGVAGISLKGERFLRSLATETGGRAFLPSREEQLAGVQDTLAADVQNRYLLSYTPTNQQADGEWRSISVATRDSAATVRARSGYYAPKSPPVRATIEFTLAAEGRELIDVTMADFAVLENGVRQEIESFQEAVSPVSIVLALDGSGSMKRGAEVARQAARQFADSLRPEDRLSLVLFADHSHFAHDLGTRREWTHQELDKYQTAGGTALYDALSDSLLRLKQVEGRRVVVVVTDGRDENNAGTGPGSSRTIRDVLQHVKEVDAVVYAIGVGGNVDRDLLEKIAATSGGRAFFPDDVTQLEAEYRRVVESLRRRWVLGFTSTDGARNGAWREVEIRFGRPDAVVHSRDGYFAPER